LQLVLAMVAFLWVRGAAEAIRRADRAEAIVALQRQEQTRAFALRSTTTRVFSNALRRSLIA
jgi:hypothetical protein